MQNEKEKIQGLNERKKRTKRKNNERKRMAQRKTNGTEKKES